MVDADSDAEVDSVKGGEITQLFACGANKRLPNPAALVGPPHAYVRICLLARTPGT